MNLPPAAAIITAAADAAVAGQLIGLPTETVYGLAADADNAHAVARIFSAKGRPSDHPLIVHIAGTKEADWRRAVDHYAHSVPDFAWALMRNFWPGPLTVILPRRDGVAEAAAGGQNSIGLRCPSHPTAQAVLHAAQQRDIWGLAAPSANRFGRVSPTTAAHVVAEFADVLAADEWLVVNGGACDVGIESTLIDASRGHPVLLRPGMLTPAQLQAACGQPVQARDANAPRASGTLASHYAPRAHVRLLDRPQLLAALQAVSPEQHIAVYSRQPLPQTPALPQVVHHTMPGDASACAQQLFAVLRALDDAGAQQIWIETPPTNPAWDGVRDRLQRAAA